MYRFSYYDHISLLIVGCGGSGTPADPTSQINTLLDNFAAGMKAHDSNKIISCFTDPFTISGTSLNSKQLLMLNFPLKEVSTIEGFPASTSPLKKYTFVNQGGNWKITAVDTP